jgi:hypothetical protein
MNDDLLAFALKSTVDEIKNACPDVSNTFIFKIDGSILAKDDDLDEETVARAVNVFKAIEKKADTVGGLESAAFYSENNRVNILKIDNLCLVLVGSEEPDGDRTAGLARILVPTVLKLTKRISEYQPETSTNDFEPQKTTGSKTEESGTNLEAKEIKTIEDEKHKQKKEDKQEIETNPEPLVTQLMVEDSGRFAGSNSVRIDSAVVQQWKDLYGEREINEVEVETLNGQKIRCRYKLIGDSKLDGKGLVQLPQKMQLILNTSKGELVTVKPVI